MLGYFKCPCFKFNKFFSYFAEKTEIRRTTHKKNEVKTYTRCSTEIYRGPYFKNYKM